MTNSPFYHLAASFRLDHLAAFTLSGEDRVRFLNGMVSADVASLRPGSGAPTFHLDHKGHIQAELAILALGESLLVLCGAAERDGVMAGLARFIIADRVELAPDARQWLAVEGPQAAAIAGRVAGVAMPSSDWSHRGIASPRVAIACAASWSGVPGVWLGSAPEDLASIESALAAAGAVASLSSEVELVRIEQGIPRHRIDFGATNLVQETGLLRHVAIGKGCYRGQETVERVRSRGGVQRQLTGLLVDGPPPAPGTPIERDGEARPVGEVTSSVASPRVARSLALGYVRMAFRAHGTALRIGGEIANVAPLPFVARPTAAPFEAKPA